MKKESQLKNKQQENPYEKVFDDANRLLKQFGDLEYLHNIPDIHKPERPGIPFPYGSNAKRPYNF